MEPIQLGDISIEVTLKKVKNVHLSVHPPTGRVTLVAPLATRPDVARAYAASRIGWIRAQQLAFATQAREPERECIPREGHYVWGHRYLMAVVYAEAKSGVALDHRRITLQVRPGADAEQRRRVLHAWHKGLLHAVVPALVAKWESRLGVRVTGYYLQRMKTKWGSCNHAEGNIRLNTELVKKPKELLEYVVVHEMLHLVEPTHNERFVALLDQHFPAWREARSELNALPLGPEEW